MRRTVLVVTAVVLLSSAACRSGVDLSTARGQLKFGVQAAKMDLWREAQFRFLRAVEMNPGDPMAYNNLAVAYEGIGEFEKAREAYLRALQIDRSNQYVQRNYSRFVEFYSKKEPREQEGESTESEESSEAAADVNTVSSDPSTPEDPPVDEPQTPEEPPEGVPPGADVPSAEDGSAPGEASAPGGEDESEEQEPDEQDAESRREGTLR